MALKVSRFFQVGMEFWNKHFNNKHIKNFEIVWILKSIKSSFAGESVCDISIYLKTILERVNAFRRLAVEQPTTILKNIF